MQAYHTRAERNPDDIPNAPETPFRAPVPGEHGEPPPAPIEEPPMYPPGTDTPGLPIPGPITL